MLIHRIKLPIRQFLSFLNLFLFGLILTSLILTLLLSSQTLEQNFEYRDLPQKVDPPLEEKILFPKNPFAQTPESYEKIGEGPFALQWVQPQMQLPDFRKELIFCGKNERPDIPKSSQFFHIALKGKDEVKTIRASEPIYLIYHGSLATSPQQRRFPSDQSPLWSDPAHHFSKGSYTFSPNNTPTSLWFEIHPINDELIEVSVGMTDEKGNAIHSPSEYRSFELPKNEGWKFQQNNWEIGGHRVDTTLLVRQKARWVGLDLFLERHGGSEFAFSTGRQRIDFLEGETPYACFIKAEDFLIWKDDRWQLADSSENTLEYPLLSIKKLDEKVIVFDLWDLTGKSKITLSLIRMRDFDPIPEIEREFKFVGAKTWAQFIIECRSQRLILKPNDWLVLTQEGWHKISSPQEVDDFVEHKLSGPLFILDKMTKQNGRQVLQGHLFNASRTEVQEIELPAIQSSLLNPYASSIALPPPLKSEADQEIKGEER